MPPDKLAIEPQQTARSPRVAPPLGPVLEYLLERQGQLVSRSELQRAIWPEGTFVDFDHELNSCVKQIRAAMGDSRSAPRFVETLVKRGVRFVAPVMPSSPAGQAGGQGVIRGRNTRIELTTRRQLTRQV